VLNILSQILLLTIGEQNDQCAATSVTSFQWRRNGYLPQQTGQVDGFIMASYVTISDFTQLEESQESHANSMGR
jgi:hypothetical protein